MKKLLLLTLTLTLTLIPTCKPTLALWDTPEERALERRQKRIEYDLNKMRLEQERLGWKLRELEWDD